MGRGVAKTVLLLGGVFLLSGEAAAQRYGPRGPGGFFGVSFVAADAVGALGTVVDQGFGLELGGGVPLAAGGHLRLRGDFGFLVYGYEKIRYCSFVCRVESQVTTTNSIGYAGIGPELVLARGDIEPYVHASAGLTYFGTHSQLNDYDGYGPYLETTNYSDAVLGFKYGGGLRVRVGGGHKPVFLDLGVERHDNGIVNYLTEGDIVDNPDGSVTLYPNRSDADLVTYRIGISIGVR